MMPPDAGAPAPLINGLSVDVEEYFQVGAFETTIRKADWGSYASRVVDNTQIVLDLFAESGVKATFFTLGWVAERHPGLIRAIVAGGHEIASHGWDHQRVFTMDAATFRADLVRTRRALEDAGGQAVTGYRAPSFSIDRRTPWAHAELAEAGYAYSSSVAPVRHDHYGWREAPRYAFRPLADSPLIELPVTVGRDRRAPHGDRGRVLSVAARRADRFRGTAGKSRSPRRDFLFPSLGGRSRSAAHRRRAAEIAVAPLCPPRRDGGQAARPDRAARMGTRRCGRRRRGGKGVMTMPLVTSPVGVREADLTDRAEATRIDAFVAAQVDATPFHLSGWSRAVAIGCGQRARYLVAERGDGAIIGVLPLTEMRSVLFGKALVSAGFAVDGGVLGDAVEPLASGAWALAQAHGCPSVELRGGAVPDGWAIDETSYLGFARDLASDDEGELLAIPRKQRAEVRRSLGFDLEVVTGDDRAMLAEHYRVYAESVRNLGTPVFPAALFRAVMRECDADILSVRHRGRAVASVLSLYMNGTVYPYWGGGTAAARALRANDRMYYALMLHARARGATRFDFGRSKTGTGAAAFKKNWGFVPEPRRYAIRSDGAPRTVNPLDPKYALMVRTWQRLPLPIANAIGPWIARGLG